MPDNQLSFDFGGQAAGRAEAAPLADVQQESCGSCRFFEPALVPKSRDPAGSCYVDVNERFVIPGSTMATSRPCTRWRPRTTEQEGSK